jgi:hypothetical protein
METLQKKIFLICPVREVTPDEQRFLINYVARLESEGHRVHYPPRDTNQKDDVGLNICMQNRDGIRNSDEVHIYWNGKSSGSKFDFGMAFMAGKPIRLVRRDMVQRTPYKSFENVLLELDEQTRNG